MIRVLIIEDEQLTANRLEKLLLKLDSEVEILAKIPSIKQAVQWLQNNAMPQLIFMDIQLSDGLSFEIFKQIEINTTVIFTTAFDQYAIEAFKVEGLDYLLKPIDEAKLQQSLQRFKKKQSSLVNIITIEDVVKLIQPSISYKNKYLVSFRDTLKPVEVNEIAYFISENKSAFIITKSNEKYSIEETLEQVEHQINPSLFFRATRQFIVSHPSIAKITQHFNGRLKLSLSPSCEEEIMVSREKSLQLKEWLNK